MLRGSNHATYEKKDARSDDWEALRLSKGVSASLRSRLSRSSRPDM